MLPRWESVKGGAISGGLRQIGRDHMYDLPCSLLCTTVWHDRTHIKFRIMTYTCFSSFYLTCLSFLKWRTSSYLKQLIQVFMIRFREKSAWCVCPRSPSFLHLYAYIWTDPDREDLDYILHIFSPVRHPQYMFHGTNIQKHSSIKTMYTSKTYSEQQTMKQENQNPWKLKRNYKKII